MERIYEEQCAKAIQINQDNPPDKNNGKYSRICFNLIRNFYFFYTVDVDDILLLEDGNIGEYLKFGVFGTYFFII